MYIAANVLHLSYEGHRSLPNIHTSLAVVKRLKLMDSGDIHFMGSFPLLAL